MTQTHQKVDQSGETWESWFATCGTYLQTAHLRFINKNEWNKTCMKCWQYPPSSLLLSPVGLPNIQYFIGVNLSRSCVDVTLSEFVLYVLSLTKLWSTYLLKHIGWGGAWNYFNRSPHPQATTHIPSLKKFILIMHGIVLKLKAER